MNTLDDAWNWYETTRDQLRLMERLGERFWEDLPWDRGLGRDNRFQDWQGSDVQQAAGLSLSYLDDLAIVVLFSVFEAIVRQYVLTELADEAAGIRHRALKLAVEDTRRLIAEGSFFHVLQPFKDEDADLVEQVHQVRRYRNWVAHGRQGSPQDNVGPPQAYSRLVQFLDVLARPPSG